MIIRHGEKLGDSSDDSSGGPDLSQRGSARAMALPQLFAPAGSTTFACALTAENGQTVTAAYNSVNVANAAPRFAVPVFLFATQASKHSNRPVETITPVATVLNLDVNDKHADKDFQKVASDILANSKYVGQNVLICWHHGKIPDLAQALGIAQPPPWPGTVFDRVWVITWPSGAASLADEPQQLLFGDSTT
jgi:hypothetical protein